MNKVQYIKEFGLDIFLVKSIRRIFLNSNSKTAWKINDYNEKLIDNYLMKTVEMAKRKCDKIKICPVNSHVPEQPIWVMWYQGIEEAPDIVKCCIESIKEHCAGHKVIVLSEKNLAEYVELPDYVIEKFEQGYISRTHLSDMIRLNLLYNYGGAWFDSTLFVTNDIPDSYFRPELFSINFGSKTKDPSHGRWTTFCFFSQKGNELIRRTLEYHYYYWMEKNHPVDYVMFDYFIGSGVNSDANARRIITSIECSNKNVFRLLDIMNEPYSEQSYDNNTIIYKLSWKRQYLKEANGKITVYGKICEHYLG